MSQQWAIERQQKIEDENLLCIDGHTLSKLVPIMEQLYKEEPLKGDQQRNFAQIIDYVIRRAVPY